MPPRHHPVCDVHTCAPLGAHRLDVIGAEATGPDQQPVPMCWTDGVFHVVKHSIITAAEELLDQLLGD